MGFRGSNASGGRIVLHQAHFGRTVLPKWPLLSYSVFSYSVSELRRACFRQARVAQAVLLQVTLFHAGAFALPFCDPKSHMCPLPHLGLSDNRGQADHDFRLNGRQSLDFSQDVAIYCPIARRLLQHQD